MASWRQPHILLFVMAAAMPISFGVWQALLNNFVIEQAAFTGIEIGILQSLREIPGFLAFGAVLLLAFLKRIDNLVFKIPFFRKYAWVVIIHASMPINNR